MMEKKPVMLMILDGFGINENTDGNAVKLAKTPNIDKLMKKYPNTIMYTSGLQVGLPEGQMGNSEVGHTNIGAGRIVYQELTKITKSIEDGDFFAIPEFIEAIENCKKNNSKLHILGLLSDGGVHSHIRHLYGLLEMAKRRDFENVYVHCFLDGRDTPPASAEGYIAQLEDKMKEKNVGKIASISGRYYAMDRDKRWDRIKKCYDALVKGADVIKRCEIFKRKSCTRTMSALEIVPCAELDQDTNNAISSKVTTMCGKLGKVEDLDPKVVDKKLESIYTTILRYQLPCSEIPSDTGKAYYHKGSLNAAVDIRKGEFITRFSAVKANEMGVDYHLVSNIATLMVPLRVAVPYGGIGAFVRLTLNDKEVNCELETVCEFLSLKATKDIPKGQEIVLKGIDRTAFKDLQFEKICSTVMDVEEFLHTKLREEREMMTRAKYAARTTEEQEEEQEEEM